MLEPVDDIATRVMVSETGANSLEEMQRLIAAHLRTSQELPNYFVYAPKTKTEIYKREMFILTVKVYYFENYISQTSIDRLRQDLFDARRRLSVLVNKNGN